MPLALHQRIITILFVCIPILVANPVFAENELQEIKMPEALHPGLQHLLELVESKESLPLDVQKVGPVIDFIDSPKESSSLYYAETEVPKGPSAYFEFNIHQDLEHILKLYYSPDIPAAACTPASIRLAYWKEVEGRKQPLPRLWQSLSGTDFPVIVRGVEYEEITPDQFSGAYYNYDLKRALVIFKHKGRNVFLSLSKQVDVSDVGRKGLVLKPDEDWNYVYSGEKGLTLTGLSWVDSYMYDSFTILILVETTPGGALVKCGTIKWLRAGWKKLNMVKNKHIFSGQQRYAKAVKTIVEHPQFPGASALSREYDRIQELSLEELRVNLIPYLNQMKKRLETEKDEQVQWAVDLFKEGQYLNQLTEKEMTAALMVEYLKASIGRNRHIPAGNLVSMKTNLSHGNRISVK